jgi:ubiquinone/menaquinone biosynthesis C-methylase UbiE
MAQETNFKQRFNTMATMYNLTFGQISLPYAKHILTLLPPITPTSTIHDNASGPGTVALEILSHYRPHPFSPRPTIHPSDFSAALIAGLDDQLATHDQWAKCIHTSIQDSQALSFDDNMFTHSIMNFSLFIMPNAERAAA